MSDIKAIYVDDNPRDRRLFQEIGKPLGWHITLVAGARQALDVLVDAECDIMFSDIKMPRMDGFDLARQVRCSSWSRLPVVLVSGIVTDETFLHATEAGANRVLSKPVLLATLRATAEDLIDRDDADTLNNSA